MSRSDQGNALASELLQPGWTVQSDGFGLTTGSANYKVDDGSTPAVNVRGTAFPVSGWNYLKAHKSTITFDALGIANIRVDYVGIDPTVGGGVMTEANTSVANGLTSENITSHPNFSSISAPFTTSIAGPAPYTQDSPDNLAPVVNGAPAYLGLKGSCFEQAKGGRFIGFVDPTGYPEYYGKTQYLARTTTYSGVIYTNSSAYIQALYLLLGTATASNSWGIFQLIPAWGPIGTTTVGNKNLLSQINVEEYGSLYKVMYEIRYSQVGWAKDVYINI